MNKITILIAFLCLTYQSLHADTKTIGEIVNVSPQHQVAFADLTSSQLAVGDVVEIFQGEEFLTYLEVIEASPEISKLGYVKKAGLATSLDGFKKISVGVKAIRLPQGSDASFDALLTQIYNLKEKNSQLTNSLNAKTQEFQEVQKQSDQAQQKLKLLKEKFTALKAALNQSNP